MHKINYKLLSIHNEKFCQMKCCCFYSSFIDHDGVIFFWFLPKWCPFKKNYKFRQFVPNWDDFICRSRTNSARLLPCHTKVVPTWHDFCPVILKSCQLGTTSAPSYWSRTNLARLLPCRTEVVPTWHDFCPVVLMSYQLGTTSALSYWCCANLTRFLPCHILFTDYYAFKQDFYNNWLLL